MYIETVPPPALQRARGTVRVAVGMRRGAARVVDLYQAGSAKAMLPRSHTAEPQVTLINTAGGLTGGDVMDLTVAAGDGAAVTVATQTAERIYRAPPGAPPASVALSLSVGAGARLDWLAQETILFDNAALDRRLTVDLAPDGQCLLVEPLILGRLAMGEGTRRLRFRDRWMIRRNGDLLHCEATDLGPTIDTLREGTAGLCDATALATVLFVGPGAEDRLGPVRAALPREGVRAAASAWDGRLVVRMMGPDPQALRQALIGVLPALRDGPLPRVWTM